MMVMMMAITPSLNASSRLFPIQNVLALKGPSGKALRTPRLRFWGIVNALHEFVVRSTGRGEPYAVVTSLFFTFGVVLLLRKSAAVPVQQSFLRRRGSVGRRCRSYRQPLPA